MLTRRLVSHRLAEAVHADQMGAFDYLPARDLAVLRDWHPIDGMVPITNEAGEGFRERLARRGTEAMSPNLHRHAIVAFPTRLEVYSSPTKQ